MKFKLLAGAAMAAAFAATGAAAQVGWYGAIDLGYHWPESIEADSSANNPVTGAPYQWRVNQEDDWAGFARLGYQLNEHWRVEAEIGYRTGDIESINSHGQTPAGTVLALCTPGVVRSSGAPTCGAPDGDAHTWSLMGNVIYDVLPGAALNPFIGVGIGAARTSINFTGQASNAYCVVRPPGHHATANRGMGFCIFNIVAVAARYAQKRYGAGRVLIVDWDVHHGNGTQDIFYRDPNVFFFSSHQWPLYPGTGRADETGDGPGTGTTMNFPFPAGSGRAEILGAIRESLTPAMEKFRPEFVLISAGFDSRVGDLLGLFTLTDQDFTDLTSAVMEIAGASAGGRLVSVLEGGYNLTGLASAAAAHVAALAATR